MSGEREGRRGGMLRVGEREFEGVSERERKVERRWERERDRWRESEMQPAPVTERTAGQSRASSDGRSGIAAVRSKERQDKRKQALNAPLRGRVINCCADERSQHCRLVSST